MVGTLLSGSLLHFTLSYDLMTVLREGEKQQRGRRELKLRPKGWAVASGIQGVSYLITHLFV